MDLPGTTKIQEYPLNDGRNVVKKVKLTRIIHENSPAEVSAQLIRESLPKKNGEPRKDADKDCSIALSDLELGSLFDLLQQVEQFRSYGPGRVRHTPRADETAALEVLQKCDSDTLNFLTSSSVDANDALKNALVRASRAQALLQYRDYMSAGEDEHKFQEWFMANPWVFATTCVEIVDERRIAVDKQADFVPVGEDGFIDLVELKRPDTPFWADELDRGNIVPSPELLKGVVQSYEYLSVLERQADSKAMEEHLGGVPILKPRATLILGRSNNWTNKHLRSQRLFNANLSNVDVITYDQALARACRINDTNMDELLAM